MNFLHSDLKTENILVGRHDANTVYLIDFGLAEHYLRPDGSHEPEVALTEFNGNLLFASNN